MGGRLDTPRLFEAQVLVVAAAGNEGTNPCTAYYDLVTTPDKLLVGATEPQWWPPTGQRTLQLASFSNYGACVHLQVLRVQS